ncbi:MAG: RecQ family ATP-dependent DNA helicase, partial [Spirochaetia bacterium]
METDPVVETAQNRFGITYLFPYQRMVIANILESSGLPEFTPWEESDLPTDTVNQIVILPTGAGKSLCFQLPACLLPGLTVVIYPLLSLMSDQERRMKGAGMETALLRGGQDREERLRITGRIKAGKVSLLITNPETLQTPPVLELLEETEVSHLVLDEAHCVSEWGDSFRPSYLGVGDAAGKINPGMVTAFTATASPEVLGKIRRYLFTGSPVSIIQGNPDRPNIAYSAVPSLCKDRTLRLLLGPDGLPRPAIVFCRSRFGAEVTARNLRESLRDREIRFYHAGLSKEEKTSIEEWFFESKTGILAATCAYGMGVDKSDIRTVIHREPSPSVEAYLQEAGRGGRDRGKSSAVLLYGPEDISSLGKVGGEGAQSRAGWFLGYLRGTECRRKVLLELLGAEYEVCFDCDVCNGDAAAEPPGKAEILRLIRTNPRSYRPGDAAGILSGEPGNLSRRNGWYRHRQFGRMGDWASDEVREAVEGLLAAG